jgi:hypothetical protein
MDIIQIHFNKNLMLKSQETIDEKVAAFIARLQKRLEPVFPAQEKGAKLDTKLKAEKSN